MRLNYFLFLTLFLFSCSSNRNNSSIDNVLLSYESGSCYGKCKVFKIKIKCNRSFEYEGIKNVRKIGKYNGEIVLKDFKEIEKLMSKIDVKNLDTIYTSNSTDLHLRILNLHYKKTSRKIVLLDNEPDELKQLEFKVHEILDKTF